MTKTNYFFLKAPFLANSSTKSFDIEWISVFPVWARICIRLILKGAIFILFIYEETAPIIFNAESTTVSLLIAQIFD